MGVYWQWADVSDGDLLPYGNETAKIVDESVGGVVAYVHCDLANRVVRMFRSEVEAA